MAQITITIQIGNSDDKLTQAKWSEFVAEVNDLVEHYSLRVHFFGGAANWMPWQNVAWIVVTEESELNAFVRDVKEVRLRYNQESVAWTLGKTDFI
jgi:hypothetical protein